MLLVINVCYIYILPKVNSIVIKSFNIKVIEILLQKETYIYLLTYKTNCIAKTNLY